MFKLSVSGPLWEGCKMLIRKSFFQNFAVFLKFLDFFIEKKCNKVFENFTVFFHFRILRESSAFGVEFQFQPVF